MLNKPGNGGNLIDTQEYENKIDSIIKDISKKAEIKEEYIDELINLINHREKWTKEEIFKNFIEISILKYYIIDTEKIETDFENKIKEGKKIETEKIKSILEGTISKIYDSLLGSETVDKNSRNLIKELIIYSIILKLYNQKFYIEQLTIKYKVGKIIRKIFGN